MNSPVDPLLYEGAGFIFVNQSYDFLLVQDTESKKWGMCKGHRDQNDVDSLATARREAEEELGLVEGIHYNVVSGPLFIQGSPRQYIFYYAMLTVSLNCIVMQKEEVCNIKMVKYHDLPNTVCNREQYNIYLRLLVSQTIGKPTQSQPSKPEPLTVVQVSNFIPRYRLKQAMEDEVMEEIPIKLDQRENTSSCILELMNEEYEEDEVIIEPPPSAFDMSESYMFVPVHLNMAELMTRSFSRPALSPSPSPSSSSRPRPRSCPSPFIPIGYGLPSPRIDGKMSPFISV
jgi:8-oxo-dGTP pyrophosphatase MutT (NUDIX family)